MKSLTVLVFLFLLSFRLPTVEKRIFNVEIDSESTMQISGSSNINDFECVFNMVKLINSGPITYVKQGDKLTFENAFLILGTSCFDCGGKGINKDFYNLLKSEEHPKITIALKKVQLTSNSNNNAEALVKLEIAGISKDYNMMIDYDEVKNWKILGKLELNIHDFKLEPPKKLLGLIKVEETIEIDFKLVLKTNTL